MYPFFRKIVFGLILLSGILVAQNISAATYYVDGNLSAVCSGGAGSSYNIAARDCSAANGTKAWKTIAACTAQLASDGGGGHICFIREGSYGETIVPAGGADLTRKNTYAAYNGETVIVPHVSLSGGQDYVRIIGLTFTGGTAHSIILYNTTGIEILYNRFAKTSPSLKAIHSANAQNSTGNQHLIIRGNEFSYIGCTWETDHCSDTVHGAPVMDLKGDKNILIEYNTAHHLSNDFAGYVYGESIVRNNYLYDMNLLRDWPNILATNSVHKDFFQGSSGTIGFNTRSRIFFDSNFMKDYVANGHLSGDAGYDACVAAGHLASQCAGSDEHFILSRVAGYDDMVVRGNVAHNIGSSGYTLERGDRSRMYNNTFVDLNTKVGNSYAIKYATSDADASENNINQNNLYSTVSNTTLGPVQVYTTSSATSTTNLCYNTGTGGVSGCTQTDDPLFADDAADYFYIAASSPARDNGSPITYAQGSGTNSDTLILDDAGFFTDGFGIAGAVAVKDTIKIGNGAPVKIAAIDYATRTVTLAGERTWQDKDGVYWRNSDTAPDIGAWEYRSDHTLSGTWSLANGTVTVVPNDASLVRFVEVLENGLPIGTASVPPYNVPGAGSGTITVKIFSLYAGQTPIVNAIYDLPGDNPPAAPTNLRVE